MFGQGVIYLLQWLSHNSSLLPNPVSEDRHKERTEIYRKQMRAVFISTNVPNMGGVSLLLLLLMYGKYINLEKNRHLTEESRHLSAQQREEG